MMRMDDPPTGRRITDRQYLVAFLIVSVALLVCALITLGVQM